MKSASAIPLLFLAGALALFALAFLSAASLGMPLAYNAADFYVHDAYYALTHVHRLLLPGTAFAIFAVVYRWLPKLTGRMLSRGLGFAHFYLTLLFTLGAFLPMCLFGIQGLRRRWRQDGHDGNSGYHEIVDLLAFWNHWEVFMSVSLILLGAAQFLFVFNLVQSVLRPQRAA